MKKLIIILLAAGFSISSGVAQQMPDPTAKKEAMAKLKMLEGKWEGSGWASAPDGSRSEFEQSEVIEEKLDGVALLIQGLGKDINSKETVHNALALITYDDNDSTYVFQSHLATGLSTTAEGHFEGEKFIWGFDVPGGKVKYTILISDDSKWNEYGEFSRDENQWYKFLEMNLVKKSK